MYIHNYFTLFKLGDRDRWERVVCLLATDLRDKSELTCSGFSIVDMVPNAAMSLTDELKPSMVAVP